MRYLVQYLLMREQAARSAQERQSSFAAYTRLMVLLLGVSTAGELSAASLTITVSNIKSDVGDMNFAIYDNDDNWLGDTVVQGRSVDVAEHISGGVLRTQFDLAPGNYAVSVHHDDNDNGKMDTNFIGIPKEPTGLSNGAVPKFGPPKYKDAVFSLSEPGLEMQIRLLD